jgi:hypothetical protein
VRGAKLGQINLQLGKSRIEPFLGRSDNRTSTSGSTLDSRGSSNFVDQVSLISRLDMIIDGSGVLR